MSATTTQLLSSGEFCKLRYDTIPVKSAPANVSFYTNNSKMPNFECDPLVANERYAENNARQKDEAISLMRQRPRLSSPKEDTFCRLVVYLMAIY
jgi:hypothetical protein